MNEMLKIIIAAECGRLVSACEEAQDAIQGVADEAESGSSKTGESFDLMNAAAALLATEFAHSMFEISGAIKDMVFDVIDAGDEIDKNSQKMQMSTDAYQQWSHVLEHGGTTIDALKLGMKNTCEVLDNLSMGVEADTTSFDRLGVSLYDSEGNLRSVEDVVKDSILSLADMDDVTQRNAIATDIFGKSASELYPTLNSGSDAIREQLTEAEKYCTMSEEQVKSCAAVKDAQQDLNDKLDLVKANFAERFTPAIQTATEKLGDFLTWCEQHPDAVYAIGTAILAVTVALGVLAVGFTVASIATTIFNSALLANPITWVIIAIVALVAALVWLCLNWDTVCDFCSGVWDGLCEHVSTGVDQNVFAFQHMSGMWDYACQKMGEVWDNIWGWITGRADEGGTSVDEKCQNAAQMAFEAFNSGGERIIDSIDCNMSEAEKMSYEYAWQMCEDAAANGEIYVQTEEGTWQKVSETVGTATDEIENNVSEMGTNIEDTMSGASESVSSSTNDMDVNASTNVQDMVNTVNQLTNEMDNSASNSASNMNKNVSNETKDMDNNVKNNAKDAMTSAIDSMNQMNSGMSSASGDANVNVTADVNALNQNVQSAMELMNSNSTSSMQDMANQLDNAASSMNTNVTSETKNMSNQTVNEVKNMSSQANKAMSDMGTDISKSTKTSTDEIVKAYENMNTKVGSAIDSMRNTVSSKLSALNSETSAKMNQLVNTVQNAVSRLKSAMNFSWSLPYLKMPHISVSGRFSVDPPSAPSFSCSWYARGGVFDSPTLFGYGNGMLGGLGENGAEAVVPLEKNTEWLDRIAERLDDKMGNGQPIVLNVDGKTFGEIAVSSINQLTRQRGSLGLNLY